jgi:4-amino-4-deoxy-L-arabinose transferase-like glycosyltransferase
LFPNDPVTGLPVTTMAARLPSALAGLFTILLLWKLASSMFGRRVGLITAVLASSSVAFLLYSPNATPEMLLTCFCTWSYVHFWYAVRARRAGARFTHMMLFYLALGLAMLAKGPAPIALVAIPLAFWWYTARPLRVLARRGLPGWRLGLVCFARELVPRTVHVFTRLWILPGLILFGLVFVPWMLAVAERHEHAWNVWNWQYWQRARGHFEDTRPRGFFYYIPVLAGLILPWLFLVFEGMAAPWLKKYADRHRALLYAGLWALIGTVVMSIMGFKKPYYVLPVVPGLFLLMGVVADRFYAWSSQLTSSSEGAGRQGVKPVRLAWMVWGLLATALVVGSAGGGIWARANVPAAFVAFMAAGALGVVLLLVAGLLYLRGRGWHALALTAVAVVAVFHGSWYTAGPLLDTARRARVLARALDEVGIPSDAVVLWADGWPDSRLHFYFQRRSRLMVLPSEIVTMVVDRTKAGAQVTLQQLVLEEANERLASSEPVYLILEQRHYDRWWRFVASPSRLVASVDSDPDTTNKDLVVVTNAAGARELGLAAE